jgi:hypothetical protein
LNTFEKYIKSNLEMNKIIFAILILAANAVSAQNQIEWDGNYQLKLSDFQSKGKQVGGTMLLVCKLRRVTVWISNEQCRIYVY